MGVKYKFTSLSSLQTSFETMYDLSLQQQGGGDHWVFLQAHAFMAAPPNPPPPVPPNLPLPAPQVSLCLADKRKKFSKAHQVLLRFPDHFVAKARKTRSSLVPAILETHKLTRAKMQPECRTS